MNTNKRFFTRGIRLSYVVLLPVKFILEKETFNSLQLESIIYPFQNKNQGFKLQYITLF